MCFLSSPTSFLANSLLRNYLSEAQCCFFNVLLLLPLPSLSFFITVNLHCGSMITILQIGGCGRGKDLLVARYIIYLTHLAPQKVVIAGKINNDSKYLQHVLQTTQALRLSLEKT